VQASQESVVTQAERETMVMLAMPQVLWMVPMLLLLLVLVAL
jgi:hypothetical protein